MSEKYVFAGFVAPPFGSTSNSAWTHPKPFSKASRHVIDAHHIRHMPHMYGDT